MKSHLTHVYAGIGPRALPVVASFRVTPGHPGEAELVALKLEES